MSLRRNNERRGSTVATTNTTVLSQQQQQQHQQTASSSFDNDESSDENMDSTESFPTDLSNRPITRSLSKLQNSTNSNYKNLENQLQNVLQSISSKPINPPPMQTYQKVVLVNEKQANLISILQRSMLTGRRPKSFSEFPDTTLQLLTKRLKTHDYPILVKRLEQLSVTLNFQNNSREYHELMKLLGELENRLVHYESSPIPSRDEFEVETINLESVRVFREYGGIDILKRILLLSLLVFQRENTTLITDSDTPTSTLRRKNKQQQQQLSPHDDPQLSGNLPVNVIVENYSILKIKCKCIHILNRIVCLPKFGKTVVQDLLYIRQGTSLALLNSSPTSSYNTILLQYLFSLLMFKESRLLSCQLIESILLNMPMLNLNRITNIRYILEKIDDEGLSSICRIFAITLSDLDISEKKYWSKSNDKKSNSDLDAIPVMSVRDQNQELLLKIPNLLTRLVGLVRDKDYAVRYQGVNSELEHWMRYIDEALSDSEDTNSEQMIFESGGSSSAPENQLYQPALIAATKLNNFVHVLYTLSLLLIGKERKLVQKSLTKLRMAHALNSLFDYLVWNCHCENHNPSGTGQTAEQQLQQQQARSHICPEVAVKIQFLRLVHSFCDHSEFKRVVLSRDEVDEVIRYNRQAHSSLQVSESMLKVEPRIGCTKDQIGLLSKIVNVIKKEPFSASFRFWLTRAIESFLRGCTSYADQMFLINRGIVQDTLHNILAINFTRPKEVLQSCFDMLGELIKFNSQGFMILDSELADTEKFNLFIRMINQSLVDSNMFLRSIFLSIEFFENNVETLDHSTAASNNTLTYFSSFERRVNLLCKMINTINLHNLSQENVSCLNTALVLLMLANRRKKLPQYLKAMQQRSIQIREASSEGDGTVVDVLANFKDLLVFWMGHYLKKDKDCVGLEQNSRIEFAYWKNTVDILLDSDPKNKCSLEFYMNCGAEFFDKQSAARIDEYRCD